MGGGYYDVDVFQQTQTQRSTNNIPNFAHGRTARSIHPTLNPKRINTKPGKKIESRESVDHPLPTPILIGFDVTGSNNTRAEAALKAMPLLMNLLLRYCSDPQIAVAANDDFNAVAENAFQISEFESDNRIDEHFNNIWLVGYGGGNSFESYDLILYAAARKTVLDSFEKRGQKGYLVLYADEMIYPVVRASHVQAVFGDNLQEDIPITDIIAEVRKMYHLFILWPHGGDQPALIQHRQLLGNEYVIELSNPSLICQEICNIVGINEQVVTIDQATQNLVNAGVSQADAHSLSQALIPLSNSMAIARPSAGLPAPGGGGKKGGAKRL
jgi:hypothetical protein